MADKRKRHKPGFKARVAEELLDVVEIGPGADELVERSSRAVPEAGKRKSLREFPNEIHVSLPPFSTLPPSTAQEHRATLADNAPMDGNLPRSRRRFVVEMIENALGSH